MSGNVWEWCHDWYGAYGSSSQTDPAGPLSGVNRVSRGGCWRFGTGRCRVSDRNYNTPGRRYDLIGLRLVLAVAVEDGASLSGRGVIIGNLLIENDKYITAMIQTALEYIEQGKKHYAEGDYECALEHFQAASQADPRSKIAYLLQAAALQKMGRIPHAQSAVYSILVADPADSKAHKYLKMLAAGQSLETIAGLRGGAAMPGENATNERYIVNGVSFNMVRVEGGTFTMGAPPDQDGFEDEKPAHCVTLDGYYIGETEVTQALWEAVTGGNPSYFKGGDLPVENVSYDDCQAFICQLNRLTGRTFRLPTEAEWEYAARGGGKSRGYKYSGSDNIGEVAWYCYNSVHKTHVVKGKKPNELGLYDMSGNVWEWCSDWYGRYSGGVQTNPAGSDSGSYRVCRGGSWYSYASYCRVSYRGYLVPAYRYDYLGFRLVLSE